MLKSGFLRKLGVPWTKCHVTQLPITWMIWEAKQLTHVDPFVGCGYLIDFDIQESKRSSNMIVLTWIQHLESWKATCQYACGSHGYTCTAHTHTYIYIFTYLWYLCIFLCLSLSFSLSLSLSLSARYSEASSCSISRMWSKDIFMRKGRFHKHHIFCLLQSENQQKEH